MRKNISNEKYQYGNGNGSAKSGKKTSNFFQPEIMRDQLDYSTSNFVPYDGSKVYSLDKTIQRRGNLHQGLYQSKMKDDLSDQTMRYYDLKYDKIQQQDDIFHLIKRPTTRERQLKMQKIQALALDQQIEERMISKISEKKPSPQKSVEKAYPLSVSFSLSTSQSPQLFSIMTPQKKQSRMDQSINNDLFYSSPGSKDLRNNPFSSAGRSSLSPSVKINELMIFPSIKVSSSALSHQERIARLDEVHKCLQGYGSNQISGYKIPDLNQGSNLDQYQESIDPINNFILPSKTEFKRIEDDDRNEIKEQSKRRKQLIAYRMMKTEAEGNFMMRPIEIIEKMNESFMNLEKQGSENSLQEVRQQQEEEERKRKRIIQLREEASLKILEEQKILLQQQLELHQRNEQLLELAAKQQKGEESHRSYQQDIIQNSARIIIEQNNRNAEKEVQQQKKKQEEEEEEDFKRKLEQMRQLQKESQRIENEKLKLLQLEKQLLRQKQREIAKPKEREQQIAKQKERDYQRQQKIKEQKERQKLKDEEIKKSKLKSTGIQVNQKLENLNDRDISLNKSRYDNNQQAKESNIQRPNEDNNYEKKAPALSREIPLIFQLNSENFQKLKERPSQIAPIPTYSPSPTNDLKFQKKNEFVSNEDLAAQVQVEMKSVKKEVERVGTQAIKKDKKSRENLREGIKQNAVSINNRSLSNQKPRKRYFSVNPAQNLITESQKQQKQEQIPSKKESTDNKQENMDNVLQNTEDIEKGQKDEDNLFISNKLQDIENSFRKTQNKLERIENVLDKLVQRENVQDKSRQSIPEYQSSNEKAGKQQNNPTIVMRNELTNSDPELVQVDQSQRFSQNNKSPLTNKGSQQQSIIQSPKTSESKQLTSNKTNIPKEEQVSKNPEPELIFQKKEDSHKDSVNSSDKSSTQIKKDEIKEPLQNSEIISESKQESEALNEGKNNNNLDHSLIKNKDQKINENTESKEKGEPQQHKEDKKKEQIPKSSQDPNRPHLKDDYPLKQNNELQEVPDIKAAEKSKHDKTSSQIPNDKQSILIADTKDQNPLNENKIKIPNPQHQEKLVKSNNELNNLVDKKQQSSKIPQNSFLTSFNYNQQKPFQSSLYPENSAKAIKLLDDLIAEINNPLENKSNI